MIRLMLALLCCVTVQAQIVNIPDANFKAKLLSADTFNTIAYNVSDLPMKIDSNGDGEIQLAEALDVYGLNLQDSNLTSLEGLEAFSNLKGLNCSNNQIASIPFGGLPNLTGLDASHNQLTSALLVSNPLLMLINCSYNPLETVDISGVQSLIIADFSHTLLSSFTAIGVLDIDKLDLDDTQLTTLDVSGVGLIQWLKCSQSDFLSEVILSPVMDMLSCNQNPLLTELDFSVSPFLANVECNENALTYLDLSEMVNLGTLSCYGNAISSINFAGAPSLSVIYANDNALTTIDLNENPSICLVDFSNNPNLTQVFMKNGPPVCTEPHDFSNNPSLQYFCTDEDEVLQMINYFGNLGMNVNVNTYCTFEPATGTYATVSGQVRYSPDGNCDAGDALPFPVMLGLTLGNTTFSAASSADGDYFFYVPPGSATVMPNLENMNYFAVTPSSHTVAATPGADYPALDFCITPNGLHPDVEIMLMPIVPARPGFEAVYRLVYRNKGNTTIDLSSLMLLYDHQRLTFVSSSVVPAAVTSNNVEWSYGQLVPFETRSIELVFQVNPPTDPEFPVNIGDVLSFTSMIWTPDEMGDENPSDNTVPFQQVVVGSYDPNDISCLEGEVEDAANIGKYLHYAIRFENTGTYQAENIVAKVVIDTAKFDVGSLQFLSASHPADVRVKGNILEFIFSGIELESGGHGNILFKIRSNPTLVPGDFVVNKAGIYFDYNFPVITNDANTVFQNLSVGGVKDVEVRLFPNPVTGTAHLTSAVGMRSVEVFDVAGRLLEVQDLSGKEATLDFSSRAAGTYFVRVTTEHGMNVQRVIRN